MKLFTLCLLLSINAIADISSFTLSSEKTLYIVDGDSVSVQMRIKGIDTPEINQKCRKTTFQVVDCGQLSKDYLKQVLKDLPGQLLIEPISIDHYNRILVKVYKDNVDIGRLMVKAGMAFSYKDTYRQEEDLARVEKLGFWGFYTPPIQPYKWRKINRR